jgi:hypothetical protein
MLAVFGMNEVDDRDGEDVRRLVAEDALRRGAGVLDRTVTTQQQDAVRAVLDEGAEALLAAANLRRCSVMRTRSPWALPTAASATTAQSTKNQRV